MDSPLGKLKIIEDGGYLTNILFNKNSNGDIEIEAIKKESPLLLEVKKQLNEYFNKERRAFDLDKIKIRLRSSPFNMKVWEALLEIPYGKTISYKDLAESIKNNRAYRAVGNANGKNPIPIIIPCHRVISNKGSLGGYSGGISIKKYLLDLEGIQI